MLGKKKKNEQQYYNEMQGQPYYGNQNPNGMPNQQYYAGGQNPNGVPNQQYYAGGQNPNGAPNQQYYAGGQNPNMQYYNGPQGQPYYGAPQNQQGGKKRKKKKNRKLLFILELLVLLILAGGLFVFAQLNKMDRVKISNVLTNISTVKEGYRNIALFGVDSRYGELDSGTNSDTIMVASINEKTGDIKLVSVYRDTYLDNTNGEYRKATECYSGGGAERAISMLNKNLDLDIKDFVTVDFNAIIKVVDAVGGIELDITEEERGWLNGYLVETSQVTGVSYNEIPSAGYQKVTGIQAMAYCRIRYTEGWDYKRTERQRIVLEKIFEAAKNQGVTGLAGIVTNMLPYISTSMSNADMLSLAAGIVKYNITETAGFPFDKVAANISAGDCVVPVNLANNVTQLHEYLFGKEGYQPSEAVMEISNHIINETGIQ